MDGQAFGIDRRRLRYSNVAIALHWLIAAMILYNLASGLLGSVLPAGFFAFHISSGITILALTIVRIAWRATHRPPPLLPMQPIEARLAGTAHFLLYVAMLAMPLTGWAMISANPPGGSPGAAWAAAHPAGRIYGPTMFWDVVRLPMIGPVANRGRTAAGVPAQRKMHQRLGSVHATGGWIMLALVLLHVGGALKHQFVDRRRELARMGLGRARPAAPRTAPAR